MLNNAKTFSSFSVRDLKNARSFYGDTLQLNVSEMPEGLQLQLGDGSSVFIYPKPQHSPASFTVLNFVVNNLEKTVDELSGRGVHFEIYNQPDIKTDSKGIHRGTQGPPKIAWFKDPDGNILSVLETGQ